MAHARAIVSLRNIRRARSRRRTATQHTQHVRSTCSHCSCTCTSSSSWYGATLTHAALSQYSRSTHIYTQHIENMQLPHPRRMHVAHATSTKHPRNIHATFTQHPRSTHAAPTQQHIHDIHLPFLFLSDMPSNIHPGE